MCYLENFIVSRRNLHCGFFGGKISGFFFVQVQIVTRSKPKLEAGISFSSKLPFVDCERLSRPQTNVTNAFWEVKKDRNFYNLMYQRAVRSYIQFYKQGLTCCCTGFCSICVCRGFCALKILRTSHSI